MSDESKNPEPARRSSSFQRSPQEHILAAIILLLGADTDYAKRLRAAQYLARTGPEVLPPLLRTLHYHPEILTPTWPWWPPQYEQLGRLLIQLSLSTHLSLNDLLHVSYLPQPPGPVLWTSVIEAAGQLPHAEYEPLLRAGLEAPWWTVRYASATAIANRAVHIALPPETREALHACQRHDPEIPVRLAASCALLRCEDKSALNALADLLETSSSLEFRRAALFILATELPAAAEPAQKQRLAHLLLRSLEDADTQITLHAARALRHVADVETLPELESLLKQHHQHTRLATLIALEELASRKILRYAIRQRQIPRRVAALLNHTDPGLRRQACFTLATLGGEYATATLGTIILHDLHPAHLEAIAALRLLPDLQHVPVLVRVLHWLHHAFTQPIELVQVRALDSLSYMIWHAHAHKHTRLLKVIFAELQQNGSLFQLLNSASAWIRQRTIELLALLDPYLSSQRPLLLEMLHHDIDSNVRACIAHTLGHSAALWAIPDLLLALLDCDEQVAEAALHALTTLPLLDNALIHYSIQEVAAYHLPLNKLKERRELITTARSWLTRHQTTPSPEQSSHYLG